MANGIDDYMSLVAQFKNSTGNIKRVVENYVLINIAKVKEVRDNKIDCYTGACNFTDVEVLMLGNKSYGVKIIPDVDDIVLLLAPRVPMESVEDFDPDFSMPPYDISGVKAVPLSVSSAPQVLSISKDGIELTGDNKLTLNSDGITIEDVNGNTIVMGSESVMINDKLEIKNG